MTIDCNNDLFFRDIQLLGTNVYDPQIGLMRNNPVDTICFNVVCFQHFPASLDKTPDRKFENGPAVHMQETAFRRRSAQLVGIATIGVQSNRAHSRMLRGDEYDGGGTITKKDTCRSVRPI